MDTGREPIDLFLQRCDDVMQSKFILSDTKISELLKSVAASDLLYAFFREITREFDYTAAKEKYMTYAPYGNAKKRRLLFPEDPSEKLAFIFCLLVDLDNKTLELSDFLREYFYEDGSVYESYYAFCNQVIKPFKNTVKNLFRGGVPQESVARMLGGERGQAAEDGKAERQDGDTPLMRAVLAEREGIYSSRLPDDKKIDALLILNALADCGGKGGAVCGLLCGYSYFAASVGRRSEYLEQMRAELEKREESL